MIYSSFNYLGLILFFVSFLQSTALDVYAANSFKKLVVSEIHKPPVENWTKLKSVEDIWNSYPDRIRFLFERLDFEKEELEPIKRLVQEGDTVKAANELLDYYKGSNSGSWLSKKIILIK